MIHIMNFITQFWPIWPSFDQTEIWRDPEISGEQMISLIIWSVEIEIRTKFCSSIKSNEIFMNFFRFKILQLRTDNIIPWIQIRKHFDILRRMCILYLLQPFTHCRSKFCSQLWINSNAMVLKMVGPNGPQIFGQKTSAKSFHPKHGPNSIHYYVLYSPKSKLFTHTHVTLSKFRSQKHHWMWWNKIKRTCSLLNSN